MSLLNGGKGRKKDVLSLVLAKTFCATFLPAQAAVAADNGLAHEEHGGSQALIAREDKKNDRTLAPLDAQGIPKWSGGWRR